MSETSVGLLVSVAGLGVGLALAVGWYALSERRNALRRHLLAITASWLVLTIAVVVRFLTVPFRVGRPSWIVIAGVVGIALGDLGFFYALRYMRQRCQLDRTGRQRRRTIPPGGRIA